MCFFFFFFGLTFSMESRDTVARCFLSAVVSLAVMALVWASITAVLQKSTSEFIHTSLTCGWTWTFIQSEAFCKTFSRPCSHLQPFPMSQISIRPSKDVVTRCPSLRKRQLEIPSQLLTSDFTSCSQPPEVMLDIVETDVPRKIFKMSVLTCPVIHFYNIQLLSKII